jgi:hypothetical protein
MEFLKAKIYDPFVNLFRSDMDRKVLALSIAVGFVSGIFPVPGMLEIRCIFDSRYSHVLRHDEPCLHRFVPASQVQRTCCSIN